MRFPATIRTASRIAGRGARLLLALALLTTILAACGAEAPAQVGTSSQPNAGLTLRIGYQKGGQLAILKGQGQLESVFAPQGVSVSWLEFPAGPPLLDAMNTGAIDFGSTGQPPAIFAQAADTDLVYVASQVGNPTGQAIIVQQDSPLQSVADLKGKKVAFAKGSSAHYFIIKALEQEGLSYADIEPVFLTPPDARPAFEGHSVDAWVIWDPFYTLALKQTGARVLRDGNGLPPSRGLYLAARSFAEQHPDVLSSVLEEIKGVEEWAEDRPKEVAEILAPVVGIEASILEEIYSRTSYGLEPINETVIADQQSVADTFFQLQLIPKQINVKDAVWTWTPKVAQGAR
jgi:sulfonate transport system substrate-binding protein